MYYKGNVVDYKNKTKQNNNNKKTTNSLAHGGNDFIGLRISTRHGRIYLSCDGQYLSIRYNQLTGSRCIGKLIYRGMTL